MRCITTLRDETSVGPDTAVGVQLVWAIRLVVMRALAALQAGVALGTDADALANLDVCHLRANAHSLANNLCPV